MCSATRRRAASTAATWASPSTPSTRPPTRTSRPTSTRSPSPPRFPTDAVPNLVDAARFAPGAPATPPVLVHVSNFRPLKRVPDVVRVFARVRAARPARLRLVGDGPDRAAALALAHELGV